MTRTLYIIVHEAHVLPWTRTHPRAQEVIDIIAQAKGRSRKLPEDRVYWAHPDFKEWYVEVEGLPRGFLDVLPPATELEAVVLGGYKWDCCTEAIIALRQAGYRATYGPCFDNGVRRPAGLLLSGMEGLIPEFFSSERS